MKELTHPGSINANNILDEYAKMFPGNYEFVALMATIYNDDITLVQIKMEHLFFEIKVLNFNLFLFYNVFI